MGGERQGAHEPAVHADKRIQVHQMRRCPSHCGGAERHKERCKFTPPVLDGQMDMIGDAACIAQGSLFERTEQDG
jgi:hypothetical protein